MPRRPTAVGVIVRLFGWALVAFGVARLVVAGLTLERVASLEPRVVLQAFAVGTWRDATFLAWLLAPVWALMALPLRSVRARRAARGGLVAWVASCTFLLLVAVVSDVAHFREFGVRLNGTSVDYLRRPAHLIRVLHHEFFLVPVALVFGVVSAFAAVRTNRAAAPLFATVRSWARAPLMLCGLTLAALLVLGSTRPARGESRVLDSATVIPHSYVANQLAVNGPSRFVSACLDGLRSDPSVGERLGGGTGADDDVLRETVFTSRDERPASRHPLQRTSPAGRVDGPRNLVVVMLESFCARGIASLGGSVDDAPEFDALAREGVLFTDAYAVGSRTNRGLAGVLSSLPALPGQSPVCALRPGDRMFSIASVLRRRGVRTVAVYGGEGSYDNLDVYARCAGFERLVDRRGIEDVTYETEWGACDDDVYAQSLRELDRLAAGDEPFFGFVLTLSNHRPYRVPAGRVDRLPPQQEGALERTAFRYADRALGDFVRAARARPWFDDTLFVFVADHGRDVRGDAAPDVESFRIPVLLLAPAHLAPRRVDRLVSQLDVAPTVFGLLHTGVVGEAVEHVSFGRDVLADTADGGAPPVRAVSALGDWLLWQQDGLLAVWPPDGPFEFYGRDSDASWKALPTTALPERTADLERRLRATARGAFVVSSPPRHVVHDVRRDDVQAAGSGADRTR